MVALISELETFKRGRTGEEIVADLLRDQGWWVISTSHMSRNDTVAPIIDGPNGQILVLPDLDVSKPGVGRRWVEVKTKESASFTHLTRRYEHGIAVNHYDDYRAIEAITGTPVFLVIVEQATGEILSASLDELEPVKRLYQGYRMDSVGMVFYPREAFKVVGTVKEVSS